MTQALPVQGEGLRDDISLPPTAPLASREVRQGWGEIRNALRLALQFAEDEAELREGAGGSMSDYITEANEVVDTVRSALRVAEDMA